jgi:hypothetical protein
MTLALVNNSGWVGVYNQPGPVSINPNSSAGNLLVLFAAWDASNTASTSAPIPASCVADSSRNWWRLGADSGNQNAGARCAIWFCHNAQAVTRWLSFALLGGYASGVEFLLAEYSGLPANYYPVVDFGPFTVFNGSSSTSLTTAATAVTADYAFGVGCIGTTGTSITQPGSPWTSLGVGVEGGSNPNGISAGAIYNTYTAGSAVTAAWTAGVASFAAACLLGISQASTSPAQISPNLPNMQTAMAFGATPGDPTTAIQDYQWADVSARSYGPSKAQLITATRGQQYELSQPEAGLMTVAFNNIDGAFNPNNPGSPYYSNAINKNMSFQTGVWSWTPNNNAKIASSSAHAFASAPNATPTLSMQVTPNGTTANPGTAAEADPINLNYKYSASAWFFVAGGWSSGAQVLINWYTSVGAYISTSAVTASAIPAGAWTQVTLPNITPPATAGLGQVIPQLIGTPSSSVVFWLAEAALVIGPSLVQTGLVRQGCPVRELAYWLGRNYPAGYGFVERWPQDWPDGLAQWGFSTMVATDSVGVASSIQLPSAVQGEVLADGPYLSLPFSEQYSTSSNTVNGVVRTASPCDGLIAANTSRVNQRPGSYKDGGNQPVQSGQSMGFLGDSGTGMGVSAYSALDKTGFRGPGVIYGPDSGLPSAGGVGCSIELFFTVPTIAQQTSTTQVQLIQVLGQPFINSAGASFLQPGFIAGAGIYLPANSTTPVVYVESPLIAAIVVGGTPVQFGQVIHVVLTLTGGVLDFYVNGINQGTCACQQLPLVAVMFGQASFSYSLGYNILYNWNYSAAYGCVYPYVLTGNRVSAHYAAGITGFQGDSVSTRFGRYMAWAGSAIPAAGPGSVVDNMQLGPAYSTGGAPLSNALNADALSSGARWYGDPSGNLVMLPRPAQYNLVPSVTFGDNVIAGEVPFTPKMGFDYDNSYVSGIVQATLQQGPNTLISPIEKDLTSIGQYFPRGPLQQSVSGSSSQDAFDRAYWSLRKYKQPSMRVKSLDVDLSSHPNAITQVLTTDLADPAIVNRRPLGGAAYSLPVTVEQVKLTVGPGVFTVGYQMSPYVPDNAVLLAGWTFTANGTPIASNYFIATAAQAALLADGQTFTDTLNSGTVFTITSVGPLSSGFRNVFFTPNAGTIMGSTDVVTQTGLDQLGNNSLAW